MSVVQTTCSTCERASGRREENPIARVHAVHTLDVRKTSGSTSLSVRKYNIMIKGTCYLLEIILKFQLS